MQTAYIALAIPKAFTAAAWRAHDDLRANLAQAFGEVTTYETAESWTDEETGLTYRDHVVRYVVKAAWTGKEPARLERMAARAAGLSGLPGVIVQHADGSAFVCTESGPRARAVGDLDE